MATLDKRVQDLERKAQPPEPVTIRIVQPGATVDDGSEVIRLVWGDEREKPEPVNLVEGADDARA